MTRCFKLNSFLNVENPTARQTMELALAFVWREIAFNRNKVITINCRRPSLLKIEWCDKTIFNLSSIIELYNLNKFCETVIS